MAGKDFINNLFPGVMPGKVGKDDYPIAELLEDPPPRNRSEATQNPDDAAVGLHAGGIDVPYRDKPHASEAERDPKEEEAPQITVLAFRKQDRFHLDRGVLLHGHWYSEKEGVFEIQGDFGLTAWVKLRKQSEFKTVSASGHVPSREAIFWRPNHLVFYRGKQVGYHQDGIYHVSHRALDADDYVSKKEDDVTILGKFSEFVRELPYISIVGQEMSRASLFQDNGFSRWDIDSPNILLQELDPDWVSVPKNPKVAPHNLDVEISMIMNKLPASVTYRRAYSQASSAHNGHALESADPTRITVRLGKGPALDWIFGTPMNITPTIPSNQILYEFSHWILSLSRKWKETEPKNPHPLDAEFYISLQNGKIKIEYHVQFLYHFDAEKFLKEELDKFGERMAPTPPEGR